MKSIAEYTVAQYLQQAHERGEDWQAAMRMMAERLVELEMPGLGNGQNGEAESDGGN